MDKGEKNRVTVNILGEEYIIRGNAPEEYMLEVASHVHNLMQKLSASNPRMSRHKLAVLAAINLTDELFRLKAGKAEEKIPFAEKKEDDDQ